VLSNHDVTRPVTRYGRADTSFAFESKRAGTPTDLELGTRRARAASLLAMALPGSIYVYQGEELGLPEVEDIPPERRQDPMWHRSGGVDPGRDGCRIPIPWAGDRPPYGFSGDGAGPPWLDPPDGWAPLTVAAQSELATSMLSLYRAGLRLRRATPELGDGSLRWIPSTDAVLAFARGERFTCIVNFGPDPVELPTGADVLIASNELEGGALPQDTTVWLSQANSIG
jgi:alpha-glucosidase